MTSPRVRFAASTGPSKASRRALLKTRRALLKGGVGALALPALAPSMARAVEPGVRRVNRALAQEGAAFVTGCEGGCVTSLLAAGHEALGDFIRAGGRLGEVRGRFRLGGGEWRTFATTALAGDVAEATANTLATRYALGADLVLVVASRWRGAILPSRSTLRTRAARRSNWAIWLWACRSTSCRQATARTRRGS
ncbi:hypothetical protein [Novosphingobium sp. MBES04]|uniref:hypothetical protein n=1 Tax=Novosphingobium sp. MBES04 TaxID=1206458 RepID=UPI0006944CF2|nr:hypothetical protein [Novosphingobium sp. MBES04]GAM05228.1 hypothetical protein MBENS4_2226 [Novosphingobium sp. MBES04]